MGVGLEVVSEAVDGAEAAEWSTNGVSTNGVSTGAGLELAEGEAARGRSLEAGLGLEEPEAVVVGEARVATGVETGAVVLTGALMRTPAQLAKGDWQMGVQLPALIDSQTSVWAGPKTNGQNQTKVPA